MVSYFRRRSPIRAAGSVIWVLCTAIFQQPAVRGHPQLAVDVRRCLERATTIWMSLYVSDQCTEADELTRHDSRCVPGRPMIPPPQTRASKVRLWMISLCVGILRVPVSSK
jgi:hypothetical protein